MLCLIADFPPNEKRSLHAMSADVISLAAPIGRQLKDLEERLASLRGYL
jgi:hypothetical protein